VRLFRRPPETVKALRRKLRETETREGYSIVLHAIDVAWQHPRLDPGECIRLVYWGQTNRPFN
jgi:hypothetical protein